MDATLTLSIDPQELKAIEATKELWEQCQKLSIQHADDIVDIKFHIHAIQNIIASRLTLRIINK